MHFAIKGFYNGFVLVIIDISIYLGTELSDWDKDQAKRYLDYIDSTFTKDGGFLPSNEQVLKFPVEMFWSQRMRKHVYKTLFIS